MRVLIINKKSYWPAVIILGIVFSGEISMAKTLNECTTDSSPAASPWWTLSAEALIFDRVGTANYTLVERVPGTTYFLAIPTTHGEPALNSTNLKQGFFPGFSLGAACHVGCNLDLLASFFHIGQWNATRSIGPDTPPNWLVMRAPGGFFQTQDFTYQSMTWCYSTKLNNAELNVQKKFSNWLTMFAGFRWLQLLENLQGTIPPPDRIQPTWKNYPKANLAYVAWFENQPGSPAPVYPPFWDTCTTNNLYGLQIGAVGTLCKHSRFCLNGLIKIGGYGNRASELTGVSIAKVVYDSGASANHAAFIGEVGLQCAYQVANWIALKIGYEVLVVTGVALAPGQIQETYSTQSSVSALGVCSRSNVFFNGVTAGLALSF